MVFNMSEEEPNWEVLELPPELEIANKNKASAANTVQDASAKYVGVEMHCTFNALLTNPDFAIFHEGSCSTTPNQRYMRLKAPKM